VPMEKRLGPIKKFANLLVQKVRVHRSLLAALAAIFLLQFYFVRELLAVELFFSLGFAAVLVLGGPAYLIGSSGASWLEGRPRSQSKATQPSGESGSLAERRVAPGTSWRVPGRGENDDPVEPFNITGKYAVEKKEDLPHATSN
jgi:hypothetical protein